MTYKEVCKFIDENLGDDWLELLGREQTYRILYDIHKKITAMRGAAKIIPHNSKDSKIFRVFREMRPQDISVIVPGISPINLVVKSEKYTTPTETTDGYLTTQYTPHYDGLAYSQSPCFSTSELDYVQITRGLLMNINELNKDFEFWLANPGSLEPLIEKGVFLPNLALTTSYPTDIDVFSVKAHLKIWEPFTQLWIKKFIAKYPDVVWGIPYLKYMELNEYLSRFDIRHLITFNTVYKECKENPLKVFNHILSSLGRPIINI